eukprot:TRINITY_DN21652_c0_g1_i1.p1 TRINITY_DN21652_c0_g1~~TRINITY_DN21652_c0_g1_i1.p1  ORF type:complete len:299 (+),score=51.07 TRINITY_DN21652_c0_g1_i1:71-898(+)
MAASRGNVPQYNFSALMQGLGPEKGPGVAQPVDGVPAVREIFSGGRPMMNMPRATQRPARQQPHIAGSPQRRGPSVQPAEEQEEEEPYQTELETWVTVFGADWEFIANIRAALNERFGSVVNCRIPRKRGNGAHYKFSDPHGALMAVQEQTLEVAGKMVYTTRCSDQSVITNPENFLNLDAATTPTAHKLSRSLPVIMRKGVPACLREVIPLYGRLLRRHWKLIAATFLFLYFYFGLSIFSLFSSTASAPASISTPPQASTTTLAESVTNNTSEF